MLSLLLLATVSLAAQELLPITAWRSHSGDNPAWASPQYDDSAWPASNYPRAALLLVQPGYAWYRASITVPAALSGQPLGISLAPINEAYEVYVNGVLAGAHGSLGAKPVGKLVNYRAFRIPPAPAGTRLQVAIRRWSGSTIINYRSTFTAVLFTQEHPPELGAATLIESMQFNRAMRCFLYMLPGLLVNVILILAAILSFSIFYADHSRRDNLWLGWALLAIGLPQLLTLAAYVQDLPGRSLLPTLSVLIQFLGNALIPLFLAAICPRLRTLLFTIALFHTAIAAMRVVSFYFDTPVLESIVVQYNTPALLGMVAPLAVAVVLLLERRSTHSILLSAALLGPQAIQAYITLFGRRMEAALGAGATLQLAYIPLGGLYLDIRALANLLFTVLAMAGLYLRHRETRQRQLLLDRDLAAARTIQQTLLTANSTPQFTIDAVYIPATEVGGDFFQTIPAPDQSLLVVAGDVSGKGLPAALLVASIVGALGDLASRRPAAVLAHLNRAMHGKTSGGFITCLCLLLEPSGKVTAANAGHLPPLSNGRFAELENGLPLGVLPDCDYTETILPYGPLTVLSDGVVEASNAKGELFGFERTAALASQPAQFIAASARQWGQNDDISVLTVRPNS